MDTPSVFQERVTDLIVRWSDGDDAALAELAPLVSAPIRSQLDKSFLLDRCRLLKFCAALQENCSAAHEQDLLSRWPEGEELRTAGAKGGKNRRRASARRKFQDVAGLICLGLIYLGYKEIARAVKGQAPRCS
jgi:hypothetical protein